MTRHGIRQYDSMQAAMHKFVQSKEAAQYSCPAPGAVLQRFSVLDSVVLLVDLRNWMDISLEGLSGLAAGHVSDNDIRDYFFYSRKTCELIISDERVCTMEVSEPVPVGERIHKAMVEVETTLGTGWLISIGPTLVRSVSVQMPFVPKHLPFRLSMVLGHSFLRYKYSKRLQVGDVLIVRNFYEEIRIGTFRLGGYHHHEGNFMFEDDYDDFLAGSMKSNEIIPDNIQPAGLSNVPVKLEFILAEKLVTLSELNQLSDGDLVATAAQGKNSVIIRGNGVIIGKGELTWVNDNLSVEIQSLYAEDSDGK